MLGRMFSNVFGSFGYGIGDLVAAGTIFELLFVALKVLEAISLWIREPTIFGL